MTQLRNHGKRLILTKPLTHRWGMTPKEDYVGYVLLGKNIPYLTSSNVILLLMGRFWLDNRGEETPSSHWYWHLDISHFRLKKSIWNKSPGLIKMYSLNFIVSKLYSSSCIQSLETWKPGERDDREPLWSLFIAVILCTQPGYLKQMAAIILPVPAFTIGFLALLTLFQVSWVHIWVGRRRNDPVLKLLPRRETRWGYSVWKNNRNSFSMVWIFKHWYPSATV